MNFLRCTCRTKNCDWLFCMLFVGNEELICIFPWMFHSLLLLVAQHSGRLMLMPFVGFVDLFAESWVQMGTLWKSRTSLQMQPREMFMISFRFLVLLSTLKSSGDIISANVLNHIYHVKILHAKLTFLKSAKSCSVCFIVSM